MVPYDKLPIALKDAMTPQEYAQIFLLKASNPEVIKLKRRVNSKDDSKKYTVEQRASRFDKDKLKNRLKTDLPLSVVFVNSIEEPDNYNHPILLTHGKLGAGTLGKARVGFDMGAGRYVLVKTGKYMESVSWDTKQYHQLEWHEILSHIYHNLLSESQILNRLGRFVGLSSSKELESIEQVYLAATLIPGETLEDFYIHDEAKSDDKILGLREHLKLLRRVIEEIDYYHSQGLLHRDLKINNILVSFSDDSDPNFEVGLIDFNVSRFMTDNEKKQGYIESDNYYGTPDYIAPELKKAFKNGEKCRYSLASECYAIGRMLTEAFYGIPDDEDKLITKGILDLRQVNKDVGVDSSSPYYKTMATSLRRIDNMVQDLQHRYLNRRPEERANKDEILLRLEQIGLAYERFVKMHKEGYENYLRDGIINSDNATAVLRNPAISRVSSSNLSDSNLAASQVPAKPTLIRSERSCNLNLLWKSEEVLDGSTATPECPKPM